MCICNNTGTDGLNRTGLFLPRASLESPRQEDSNQGLAKVLFLKQLADFQKFTDPGWEAKQF